MPPYNPENWVDLVGLGITGTALAVVAWLSHRRLKGPLDEVKDQVQNGHTDTNLRDDIDRLTALVVDGFHETRQDIRGLREEMRIERVERIEGDRRGMRRIGLIDDDG